MTQNTLEAAKARQTAMDGKEPNLPPPNEITEEQFKANIDFSKVKNVRALEAADREGAKMVSEKTKQLKRQKRKFSFQEPVTLELPSHGRFYQDSTDPDIRAGYIKLRPMSTVEEEIMTNPVNLKSGTAIMKLFDSCIDSDYSAEDLLTFDSTYLLYALRKETYGDEYTFKIQCPDCEREFEHTVLISDLSFPEFPDNIDDPMVFKLPISKYTVVMCLPRLHHAEQLYRFTKDNEEYSERVMNLVVQTLSIKDEKGKEINPQDYADFYEAIPGADRAVITDGFKFDTGIERITYTCQNPRCAKEFKGGVPVSLEFFRLN